MLSRPLAIGACLCLALGFDAVLVASGRPAPLSAVPLAETAGPLLVLGPLGTLAGIRAARRHGAARAWTVPCVVLLAALALALLSVLGTSTLVPRLLLVLGTALLAAVHRRPWKRDPDPGTAVSALGAVFALGAACQFSVGVAPHVLVPWYVGFVVCTFLLAPVLGAGRDPGPRRHDVLLVVLALVFALGIPVSTLWPLTGRVLGGLALLGILALVCVRGVRERRDA